MSTVLCVGEMNDWEDALRKVAEVAETHFVCFGEVTSDLFCRLAPDTVISPLLSSNFDATDLAKQLQSLGFAGTYLAVAQGVPEPRIIEREVKTAAPLIDFDLIVLSGASKLN